MSLLKLKYNNMQYSLPSIAKIDITPAVPGYELNLTIL